MNGHELRAGGDSDDGKEPIRNQQQIHEVETLDTSWSHISAAVLMIGSIEKKAICLDKELNTKAIGSSKGAFPATYVSQKTQEKSEKARSFTEGEDSNPKGVFYYMLLAAHPRDLALRLSNLYEAKRTEGKSEAWAGAYTRKVILENKTNEEAEVYAKELDRSFTIMERFSKVAQPGDVEEQGMKAERYRFALRKKGPLSVAKLYADHVEQQLQLGKPYEWALAYAEMRVWGEDDAFAHTFADHVEQQLQLGKSHDWAEAYAEMRVQGQDDTWATIYADHKEQQLQLGKSDDWALAYASRRAFGQDDTWATIYADHKEQQLQLDKSRAWAHAYAKHRAHGKSHTEARRYANKLSLKDS